MPSATKKRKVSATKSATTPSRPLDAFTSVSKAGSVTKSALDKNYVVGLPASVDFDDAVEEKKRKLDVEGEGAVQAVPAIFAATTNNHTIKQLPKRRSIRLPQTPLKLNAISKHPVSADTPTKGARSLFDRLHFSSPTPTRSPLNTVTKPSDSQSAIFPIELFDLIQLHAAFLTALSLHYAHNGTHSPADLRLLCPDIARAWGKRKIALEDIRRTLGVMNTVTTERNKNSRLSRLTLSDYGHGKICIEIDTGGGKAGRLARPVNENLLNEIFVGELRKLWGERDGMDTNIQEFVEGLPLEPINTCSSLAKMSPLLAKGQRRLEDMRAGIIIKEAATKEKVAVLERPNGTKSTLLERLRAKQLEQANKPPAPTKADLSRRAAFHRLDEVVSVLSILSTSNSIGQSRISFTMPTVLGKLQDSFRTPISKEEGDACVRLLASDIAPKWVKIIKMGKVEALAVNRDDRPTDMEITERIRGAV